MNEQDRIARLVFQEMENEKITEKLKHVETIELIKELSNRINSNLYVPCIKCTEAGKEGIDTYFGLENTLTISGNVALCKKHR